MADNFMQMSPAMLPFYDTNAIAQNQADLYKWQQQQQMAQALMQAPYAPGSGRAGAIAGGLTRLLGLLQNNSGNAKLSDLLKTQFEIGNQAATAKRQQDLQDEYRKLQEDIFKSQQESIGKAKAEKDFQKSVVEGGMIVDPNNPAGSAAIPGYADMQIGLAGGKANAEAAARARYAGAADSAKLGMIQRLMAQPDSPTKTAQLSSLLGQGGMEAMMFSGMGVGGGQGGALGAGPSGDDFLKSLNPGMAAQVKAISEGRQAPPSSMAMRSPMGQALMAAVTQYDPSFDATNYAARNKVRQGFTGGKEGQTINAINTAIGHAGSLMDAADALNNTSFPLLNKGLNAMAVAGGDPRVQNFNVARDALAGEITKAFRGSSGNESDIKEIRENLSAANSPEQLKAAIQQATHLLGSKVSSLGNQYQAAFGANSKPNILDPNAQAVLKKLSAHGLDLGELGADEGISSDSAAPAASGAPTMTATGPNGQKIGLINGQWVPL